MPGTVACVLQPLLLLGGTEIGGKEMIRTLIKAMAYTRMPRTALMLSHPRATTRMMKTRWDLKHALAPRITAAGAAIIALPIGYALGRAMRSGSKLGRTSTSGSTTMGARGFVDTETIVAD